LKIIQIFFVRRINYFSAFLDFLPPLLPPGDVLLLVSAELFALDDLPAVLEDFGLFADVAVLLLFDELLPLELLAFAVTLPLLAFEDSTFGLLGFNNLSAISDAFVSTFPEVSAFVEVLFSSLPNISPTASATTFITPSAAPCAALDRISPAASFTLSIISDDELFLALFDFAELDFLAVGFLLSFFVVIILPSLVFIIKT
jgi:hypothetical protein